MYQEDINERKFNLQLAKAEVYEVFRQLRNKEMTANEILDQVRKLHKNEHKTGTLFTIQDVLSDVQDNDEFEILVTEQRTTKRYKIYVKGTSEITNSVQFEEFLKNQGGSFQADFKIFECTYEGMEQDLRNLIDQTRLTVYNIRDTKSYQRLYLMQEALFDNQLQKEMFQRWFREEYQRSEQKSHDELRRRQSSILGEVTQASGRTKQKEMAVMNYWISGLKEEVTRIQKQP